MNLLKTLATVSSMTLISRVLGFVRDFIIARVFGAGLLTDAFFVAFKLPNLLRRLFAEGAFSQAFVPLLGEYKNQRGSLAAKTLLDRVATLLFLVVLAVTLVGVIGAPWIVYISAPGFAADPQKFDLTVDLTRITFPYIFFMSLVALSGGILNTWSRFSLPAATPILLNVSLIIAAQFMAPYFERPVIALAWGVFIGGLLQLLLQLPSLKKIGMLPRFSFHLHDEGVRRVLKLMGPATLGVSVAQLSLLINTVFATFISTGSVSWLYYADRLMEFPSGMLGAALGTILLPSLSKYHASGKIKDYQKLLDWGLRLSLLLAAPAAVALSILSAPLIATLFYRGAFTQLDVFKTQEALIAYSVGLTALILIKVLAPGFYAQQNTRTPVKIALISLAVTQALNLILMIPLQHAGLALSISLAACLNAFLLLRGLRKQHIYVPEAGWRSFLLKLAVALILMGGSLIFLKGSSAEWLTWTTADRIIRLAWLIPLAITLYFSSLWCLGFRLADFKRHAASAP